MPWRGTVCAAATISITGALPVPVKNKMTGVEETPALNAPQRRGGRRDGSRPLLAGRPIRLIMLKGAPVGWFDLDTDVHGVDSRAATAATGTR